MVVVSKPVLIIALIKHYQGGRQEIISLFADGIFRLNVCWLLYLSMKVTA